MFIYLQNSNFASSKKRKIISTTMKQKTLILVAAASLSMASCGTIGTTGTASSAAGNAVGSILGAITNGETVGNILSSVIGTNKVTAEQLVGTWRYSGPGCAFTSDNALAKAGGEVAATEVKNKLKTQYSQLGFSSSNTYVTFKQDGTFSAKIDGKSWSGNYTFDESNQEINFAGLIINLKGYTKRNTSGISILFESKKVLTLFQTLASLSGNSTAQVISDISKNYNGVRIGFDMKN